MDDSTLDAIKRGQDEEGQERGRENASDDDGGQRLLDFGAGSGGHGHGNEPKESRKVVERQTANYRRFRELIQKWVDAEIELCKLKLKGKAGI